MLPMRVPIGLSKWLSKNACNARLLHVSYGTKGLMPDPTVSMNMICARPSLCTDGVVGYAKTTSVVDSHLILQSCKP